jgi:hypothetical protein
MWGYIPVKERLQLEGDVEMNPGPHHLTWVNQFSKWDRQLEADISSDSTLRFFAARSSRCFAGLLILAGANGRLD